MVLRDDSYHQPAKFFEQLPAANIPDVLPTVGSVLIAVVLDADL
jgi:hypothetical protein